MVYAVKISDKALKGLKKLDKQVQIRVLDFLKQLGKEKNPRSEGKALKGNLKSLWRYRLGDYRIIADIQDKNVTIVVVKVSHRKDVYH